MGEDNLMYPLHHSASAEGVLFPYPCDPDQQGQQCRSGNREQDTQRGDLEHRKRQRGQHRRQDQQSAHHVKDRVGHPASIVFPMRPKADLLMLEFFMFHPTISLYHNFCSNSPNPA